MAGPSPGGVGVHLQGAFGQLHPKRSETGYERTQFEGPLEQAVGFFGVYDLADQSASVGFLRRHHATGQHPVRGDAGADDAR